MSFSLYILKSKIKDRYYIGHTNDLDRRLTEHNTGQTKSTRSYKPWELVYHKTYSHKSDAAKAENFLKAKKSKIFIERIISGKVTLER